MQVYENICKYLLHYINQKLKQGASNVAQQAESPMQHQYPRHLSND